MQHVRAALSTQSRLRGKVGLIISRGTSLLGCSISRNGEPSLFRPTTLLCEQRAGLRVKPRYIKYELPEPTHKPSEQSPFRKRQRQDGEADRIRTPRPSTSDTVLEKELAWIAKNKAQRSDIRDILRILIEERGMQPSAQHYEALILENCDPRQGSIEHVQAVLDDMKADNIATSAAIHSAILKVLTIHPNPNLRKATLEQMAESWLTLTTEDRHMVVAALIREGQLELAEDEMNKMRHDSVQVETWLHVLLMYTLLENRDYDAILRLAYQLHNEKTELPSALWRSMLDDRRARTDQHFHLFRWVWDKYVEPLHIKPPRRTCVNAVAMLVARREHQFAERVASTLKALYPDAAEQTSKLLSEANADSDQSKHFSSPPLLTMAEAFSKSSGHEKAYFDPRIAMKKRPLKRFMNPRREQQRLRYKEFLRNNFKRVH